MYRRSVLASDLKNQMKDLHWLILADSVGAELAEIIVEEYLKVGEDPT